MIFDLIDWSYHLLLPIIMRAATSLCGLLVLLSAAFVAIAAELAYGWDGAWVYIVASIPFMILGLLAIIAGIWLA
jgi:hypothetical protein